MFWMSLNQSASTAVCPLSDVAKKDEQVIVGNGRAPRRQQRQNRRFALRQIQRRRRRQSTNRFQLVQLNHRWRIRRTMVMSRHIARFIQPNQQRRRDARLQKGYVVAAP